MLKLSAHFELEFWALVLLSWQDIDLPFITSVLPSVLQMNTESALGSSLEQDHLLIPQFLIIIQSRSQSMLCQSVIQHHRWWINLIFVPNIFLILLVLLFIHLWCKNESTYSKLDLRMQRYWLWNSPSALWQCTAAYYSFALHWHVNTQRVTWETRTLLPLQIPAWLTGDAHPLLSGWLFAAGDLWAWNVNRS